MKDIHVINFTSAPVYCVPSHILVSAFCFAFL